LKEGAVLRKYLNIALAYAIAGMVGGVFYREFTKWNDFTGATALGVVHAHLFILGMLVFIVIALFARSGGLEETRTFRAFMLTYNAGLVLTVAMLVVRGVVQVLGIALATGADAAISGIAGCGHMALGAGMILLIVSLKKQEGLRHA